MDFIFQLNNLFLPDCYLIKEGKAEGRIEEKRENAHKLKKLGITTDIISQATGLSNEDIDNFI